MKVKDRVLKLLQVDASLWKDIKDFPGYQVSREGQIRSCRIDGPSKSFGDWHFLKQIEDSRRSKMPYKFVVLCSKGKPYRKAVHRLVLEAFVGPQPLGFQGSHLDGNPSNNYLDNLRWESRSTNNLRKSQHGTDNKGERHNLAVLSVYDVKEIRRLSCLGYSQRSLARMFGLKSHTSIGYIVNRKQWLHI